ncbi:MAG TPA: hypothetical protein VE954_06960 [Oligoflexus sp.]|uniref:hypothetical protein n=1 Tax=Oligoflexus sp. TaxID=1971216 RepID=UPI002D2752C6|nr:hypothetical protein [Oligoflexus sp.]HYX32836.1 hypothetical protein [Oligoflexus sp.]
MSQSKIDEDIPLDRVGQVIAGKGCGQYVRVVYDTVKTGGYYIFQSTSKKFDSPETYDGWFEDMETVTIVFKERGWIIEWQPELKLV